MQPYKASLATGKPVRYVVLSAIDRAYDVLTKVTFLLYEVCSIYLTL